MTVRTVQSHRVLEAEDWRKRIHERPRARGFARDRIASGPFLFPNMTIKTRPASKRAQFTVQRERAEGGTYSMTIGVNDASRNPFDVIRMDGGQFGNYMRNPVVLWSHDDTALPIGRTTKLRYEDGKLRADFEFLPDDPMAERVKRAWDLGFVNAASIRFLPLKADESDVVTEWDLLEWSLVPIPADPDALRAAARALNVPVEVLRLEDDEMPEDEPEVQPEGETPTVEELAEKIAALEEREAEFDQKIEERVGALEEKDEGEPEEDEPESDEPVDEPDDENERLLAEINDVLRVVREKSQ